MNQISKQAINSMNYFFLREVFQKNKISKEVSEEIESSRALGEVGDNIYMRVFEELSMFLKQVSEENLTEDMISILSKELKEGDYMSDLSFDEVREMFDNAIKDILGYEDEVLLNKYISIADTIYND